MGEPESRQLGQYIRALVHATGSLGLTVPRRPDIPRNMSRLLRYGFAGILAAVAVWLRLLMNLEMNNDALRMVSVIAVALAAWSGGFGPGILATAVGLAGSLAIRPRTNIAVKKGH